MDLQQAVKIRILKLCEQRNITINKLCTLSGIAQSTVSGLMSGTSQNPKLLTIVRLCYGLNMPLSEFFDDEIFANIDDD